MSEKKFFLVRPCSTSGAFKINPLKKTSFDLRSLEPALSKELGAKSVVSTPLLLLVSVHGVEVTLYHNGKLLLKNCPSQQKAEEVAEKIYSIVRSV